MNTPANPINDPTATPDAEAAYTHRIEDLPKEVGVMLMTVGVLGMALPGVVGGPALIAGGLVLWPKTFGRVESWFERRFPKAHLHSMQQINRYLDDLEKRFPESDQPKG
ncbi:MAG: hypothetical protein P4L85_12175 [Paludisphaera borealis]|uniref:hypothetical protein n=1 Tax=Paludisphaera borealis TaxID=1387353 RepID=UPI00284B02E0|nr:hypothetical protein [Paludisphaera borealis]MDR3620100.1 hypothetical protein [Paludisphaera borealis]